jgi:hypothetical protein
VSYHTSAGGGRSCRSGVPEMERGSRKRLNRIKWQPHTPMHFRVFVFVLLLTLIALGTWLLNHPPEPNHFHPHGPSSREAPLPPP